MRKILLTSMSLILLSSLWMSPVLAGFKDVDGNRKYKWAKSSIDEMNRRGIVTGFSDGTFRPDQAVTKAEFTVMVYRLFPLLRNPKPSPIRGVPAKHWASRQFSELYSTIYPSDAADFNLDGSNYIYKPEKRMTRWEVLMTLNALFKNVQGPNIDNLGTSKTVKELAKVKDIPQRKFTSFEQFEKHREGSLFMTPNLFLVQYKDGIDWGGDFDYAKAQALYRSIKLGIIQPDAKGFLYPNKLVTRGEIVTILNRMLKLAGEDYAYVEKEDAEPGTYSYLYPGGSTGFGANLYYSEPDSFIVFNSAYGNKPEERLQDVFIRIESEQVMDVYVTMNNKTTKYTYEQFANGASKVYLNVQGMRKIYVQGKARYPKLLKENGNNNVMIYVMDPDMKPVEYR